MRVKSGATPEAALDMMIEGVLIALMVFTALAFGGVHAWAQSLMQAGVVLMTALWLCRTIWSRPSSRPARSFPGADRSLHVLGYSFVHTGLGLPILLFVILVLFQMAPLPPAAVRLVSPAAAESFARSLPGYADGGPVDFTVMDSWLLEDGAGSLPGEARRGGALKQWLESAEPAPRGPDTPGVPEIGALVYPAARPTSLYPFGTQGRLIMLLALAAVFVVVVNNFRSRPQNERVLWVISLVGFSMSVLGVVQLLQWNGKIYWFYPASEYASPFGPFFNHNHFSAYLEMAIPLTLGLFMQSIRRAPDARARLFLSGFPLTVMLAALLLAGSRGALLSLGAAALLYGGLMWARREMGLLESIAACGAAVIGLCFAAWIGMAHLGETTRKFQSMADFRSEPSLAARLVGWGYTLRILKDYPIVGCGLGAFPEAWIHYYPPGTANVWKEAQNDYLQVAAETGAVGLAVFLWGFWRFTARFLLKAPRSAPGDWAGDVYLHHGIAIGVISILFHSWVDYSLQVPAIALLFVVLSAIMVGDRARDAGDA